MKGSHHTKIGRVLRVQIATHVTINGPERPHTCRRISELEMYKRAKKNTHIIFQSIVGTNQRGLKTSILSLLCVIATPPKGLSGAGQISRAHSTVQLRQTIVPALPPMMVHPPKQSLLHWAGNQPFPGRPHTETKTISSDHTTITGLVEKLRQHENGVQASELLLRGQDQHNSSLSCCM